MNEAEFIEAGREWLKKDRQDRQKKWRQARAQFKENNPDWDRNNYENHKVLFLDYAEKYRDEHRESINEYVREYKKTEKGKATTRKYVESEKGRANNQRGHFKRRANEKNTVNTLTAQEWLDILEEYNYRCAYCGIEFDCETLPTKDHIIPVSKGGDNVKENIVPACRSCNSRKNSN